MSLSVERGDALGATGTTMLLCRVGTRLCALPIEHVVETMRPLPTEPLAGVLPFVSGVAVVRGSPTPVVDVGRLLDPATAPRPATRFVTVRIGERRAALSFDAVLGVRRFGPLATQPMPPLLEHAASDVARAIGAVDAELLIVLESARTVPEDVWRAMDGPSAPS